MSKDWDASSFFRTLCACDDPDLEPFVLLLFEESPESVLFPEE